jgi:hypothetical protein
LAAHFKILKRILFILLLFMVSLTQAQNTSGKEETKTESNKGADSTKKVKYFRHPFIDSLRIDSTRKVLFKKFSINLPSKIIPKKQDPFDPFLHPAYYRRGQGKIWFFFVSLIVLALFIYYRTAFPKQFSLRIRGVFNRHYFDELVAESSLSSTGGSLLNAVISNLVLGQLILLIVLYSRYVQLNNAFFYLLLIVAVVLYKGAVYGLQRLQSYVLNTGDFLQRMMHRQISMDFILSFAVFPAVNIIYFNAGRFDFEIMREMLAGLFFAWLGIRLLAEAITLIGEKPLTFAHILYFCTFELLPNAILVNLLLRIYRAQ